MKTLIFALTFVVSFAHAATSKECGNITEIADTLKKAIFVDGPLYAVRLSDIQVATPLHPVTNLVSFELLGDAMKIKIANTERFETVHRTCARSEIIEAYSLAVCELNTVLETLQPFRISKETAVADAALVQVGRTAVDNAQASSDLINKNISALNKNVSLKLIQIGNEVAGINVGLRKKSVVENTILPFKTSLEGMVRKWTRQPVNCAVILKP